jgi:hypothetical protein
MSATEKSDLGITQRHRIAALALLTFLGFLLYLGFLSSNYDLNGINEVAAIERGGASLTPPNHLLYRPVVRLIFAVLQTAGYGGRSLQPAQVATALCGIFGLGLFFLWTDKLINNTLVAAIASLGFGTSYAYWLYSIEISYIVPAAMTALGALLLLANGLDMYAPQPPVTHLVGVGILSALAVLFWQANIFFLPVVFMGIALKFKSDIPSLLKAVAVFAATVSLALGCAYVLVAAFVLEDRSIAGFLDWLLHYGAPLPMWGRWEVVRIFQAAKSAVGSLIPVGQGLGLRLLLRGEFEQSKLLSQTSLLALVFLFLAPLFVVAKKRSLSAPRIYLLGWLLSAYVVFLPFIVWWDPFEPKWFIIPNIALWASVAVLWGSTVRNSKDSVLFAVLVLIILLANLSATIRPRHSEPNRLFQRAECVAEHMDEGDLFVATDWDWPGYVVYFFDKQVFSLIDAAARYEGRAAALTVLQERIDATHRRGGKAYVVAVETYPAEHLKWLTTQTGLMPDDLRRFRRVPAFFCDDVTFQELRETK